MGLLTKTFKTTHDGVLTRNVRTLNVILHFLFVVMKHKIDHLGMIHCLKLYDCITTSHAAYSFNQNTPNGITDKGAENC
jgi:hypothetical protein